MEHTLFSVELDNPEFTENNNITHHEYFEEGQALSQKKDSLPRIIYERYKSYFMKYHYVATFTNELSTFTNDSESEMENVLVDNIYDVKSLILENERKISSEIEYAPVFKNLPRVSAVGSLDRLPCYNGFGFFRNGFKSTISRQIYEKNTETRLKLKGMPYQECHGSKKPNSSNWDGCPVITFHFINQNLREETLLCLQLGGLNLIRFLEQLSNIEEDVQSCISDSGQYE